MQNMTTCSSCWTDQCSPRSACLCFASFSLISHFNVLMVLLARVEQRFRNSLNYIKARIIYRQTFSRTGIQFPRSSKYLLFVKSG